MIAYIKGAIVHKDTKQVIIDVNGIGYAVEVTPRVITGLPPIGEIVTLYTHYYQNRDNKVTLYGFTSMDALKIFELALTVSGVGTGTCPKYCFEVVAVPIPTRRTAWRYNHPDARAAFKQRPRTSDHYQTKK